MPQPAWALRCAEHITAEPQRNVFQALNLQDCNRSVAWKVVHTLAKQASTRIHPLDWNPVEIHASIHSLPRG